MIVAFGPGFGPGGPHLCHHPGEAAIVGIREDNSIVGTWAMGGESEGTGHIERTWAFNDDMTGDYSGDIGSSDISNIKIDGKVATFDVTLEVQGHELPSKFTGTLEGGVLSGELSHLERAHVPSPGTSPARKMWLYKTRERLI